MYVAVKSFMPTLRGATEAQLLRDSYENVVGGMPADQRKVLCKNLRCYNACKRLWKERAKPVKDRARKELEGRKRGLKRTAEGGVLRRTQHALLRDRIKRADAYVEWANGRGQCPIKKSTGRRVRGGLHGSVGPLPSGSWTR